jgi:hypothetical protein
MRVLSRIVDWALAKGGFSLRPLSPDGWRWSETVDDYYPVRPRSRWEPEAPHRRLRAILEAGRPTYEATLDLFSTHRATLHAVAQHPDVNRPSAPYWANQWFSTLDAASLVGFLLSRRPAQYFEIGSGHSTRFARYAIDAGGLTTKITSIDPEPRADIDKLCDRSIRAPLEACDLDLFRHAQPGDIVFYDGSHRVFQNSDTTVFFLEVLPRLAPGVLVHVHDIFLPCDYPAAWTGRLYSEQYLLAAMLLGMTSTFQVLLPNYFVCMDPDLGLRVRELFRAPTGPDIPFLYTNPGNTPGVSFWITITGPGGTSP